MDKLKPKNTNEKERLNFVRYWAGYVKMNKDEEWGKQHNKFINALQKNAKNYALTAKQYLGLKKEL